MLLFFPISVNWKSGTMKFLQSGDGSSCCGESPMGEYDRLGGVLKMNGLVLWLG